MTSKLGPPSHKPGTNAGNAQESSLRRALFFGESRNIFIPCSTICWHNLVTTLEVIMVHWVWILVALVVGGTGGLLMSAMCVMSCSKSVEDQIDRETCCGACNPGCTD